MILNRIRQIDVEKVVTTPENETTKFITMTYIFGGNRTFNINNKKVFRTISEIIETENGFIIYITNDQTTQKWIELKSKERVTVYYFID